MMTGVHRNFGSVMSFFEANNLCQLRFGFDLDRVRDSHGSSCSMWDGRFDMLDQRAAAVYIQTLQSIADAENRLAGVVGIVQKYPVDGVPSGIRCRGLRGALRFG